MADTPVPVEPGTVPVPLAAPVPIAAREAQPRRLPLVAVALVLVLVGALVGPGDRAAARTTGGSVTAGASAVPARAVDSSWTCGGGTQTSSGSLPSELLLQDASPLAALATVELVTPSQQRQTEKVSIPARGSVTLAESVSGSSGGWTGAFVTINTGMAAVSQVVASRWGETTEPCASSTSSSWYFPEGMTLRNAYEYLSLVNPYPVERVVDLSFATDLGPAQPGPFLGVVVPARGMTVLALNTEIPLRAHVSTTVKTRSGGVVAFETQLVTTPPKGSQVLGTPHAIDPAAPRAGVVLTLGATSASRQLWWPSGGEAQGTTEAFVAYNPGARDAEATLTLTAAGTAPGVARVGGTHHFVVPPGGWAEVTTNGQPWALSAPSYSAVLTTAGGANVVAERYVTSTGPGGTLGIAGALGQSQASEEWELATVPPILALSRLPGPMTLVLALVDPGRRGGYITLAGSRTAVTPGQRAVLNVPAADWAGGQPVELHSTVPVLVEEDLTAPPPGVGLCLGPALPVDERA